MLLKMHNLLEHIAYVSVSLYRTWNLKKCGGMSFKTSMTSYLPWDNFFFINVYVLNDTVYGKWGPGAVKLQKYI